MSKELFWKNFNLSANYQCEKQILTDFIGIKSGSEVVVPIERVSEILEIVKKCEFCHGLGSDFKFIEPASSRRRSNSSISENSGSE